MADLRAQAEINLKGNLSRKAADNARALERLSTRGRNAMRTLSDSTTRLGQTLGRLGGRTAALVGGIGLGAMAKRTMDMDVRLARLSVQAQSSTEDIAELYGQVQKVAALEGIRVDPKEVLGAIEAIVERTGDLDFARNNIENLATAIQATGANGEAIGGIVAEFQKMGLLDPSQVEEAFDILNAQGKEGAFTLANLAALGPRVVAAYTASGRGGIQALREMGATLQMIRRATGSSEMAATAFEALMRTLQDADKIKMLQAGGIRLFEDDGTTLRPINELMAEIVQLTQGKASVLSAVFDAEAIRAFNSMLSEFNRTGQVGDITHFMNVDGSGQTASDAAVIAATAGMKAQSATHELDATIQDGLIPALDGVADAFTEFRKGNNTSALGSLSDAGEDYGLGRSGFYTFSEWRDAGRGVGESLWAALTETPLAEQVTQEQGEASVTVRFEGAPPGTQVSTTASGITVETDVGYQMQGTR